MKNILLLLLFFIEICFSQTIPTAFNKIVEAEAKTASSKIKFKANILTSNYDVTYYKLEFTVDPAVAFINGVITTTFTAKSNMNTVVFDLDDNMLVSAVSQNGNPLSYTQNSNDELSITLSNTLLKGQSTSVKITYSGNPVSSGFGSFEQTYHNGSPIIWTLSEPYGAKAWWPCKQDLIDKADSIDVYITAPKEYVAVSNGLEQSQTISGNLKTTHFKHQHPIPAYLIAIAVSNYSVYTHTVQNNGNPYEIVNYVYPENLTTAQNNTGVTVDIINLYSDLFETYPYADEKYGHAQFSWGGGMEHTTVSFMYNFDRDLIAHELAHQWFGDKVTCGSWKDIWLNEGFATYLNLLTVEKLSGEPTFKAYRASYINNITSLPDGSVYLSDADTTDIGRIFSGRLSYRKGSMVLHMLRKKIGDINFFKGLQNYLDDPDLAFSFAKTPDLIQHMEAASGSDLTEFFNDWVYNQGYPSYTVSWHQQPGNLLNIKIEQTQSDASVSYFEAPVPIRVNGINNEVLDLVLDNTYNGQEFNESISFTALSVVVDPDYHLISKNNTAVLGIKEDFLLNTSLFIYPNPTSSELNISLPGDVKAELFTVFNTLGQHVLDSTSAPIDITKLKSGMYIVRISTNYGQINKTFLKK